WDRMPPPARMAAGQELADDAKQLAARPVVEQLRFARLYSFHPAGVGVVNRLVDRSLEAGEFARAEQLLSRLRLNADVAVAASATERFAKLLQARKLAGDANVVYTELASKYAKVRLPGGTTAAELVAELRARRVVGPGAVPQPVSWGHSSMRVEQAGTQYQSSPNQGLLVGTSRFPYFREHSFQIDHSNQQLVVTRVADDSLSWLVPLRSGRNSSGNQYTYAASFGHCLLVMHRNVLHCLSPVDKRVVWTRQLENRAATSYYSYYSSSPTRNRYRPLQDGSRVAATYALSNSFAQKGGLAFANTMYVGVYGRRRLLLLDAGTGDVLWTLSGLRQGSKVIGSTDAVFVLNNGDEPVIALRALDGRKLTEAKAAKSAAKAVGVSGNDLLIPDATTSNFLGLRRSTTTWKLQNPVTGATRWTRRYGSGTSFSLLDDGNIVVLPRKGPLEVIDRSTGASSTYPVTGKELRKSRQIYALADRNTLFVIANKGGRSGYYYGYGGLTTVSVSGEIHAFDRLTRKRLWKTSVSNQQLVMDHFDLSPVLAFSTRKYVRKGLIQHQTLSLQAIDKRTGTTLIEKQIPSNQYYGSFNVNLRDRYVEFRTYSHRLRLVAVAGTRPPVTADRPKHAAE
ncbi:MAG: PQQ-binding-like beta-propeller repeat protein, partial [Planctomycetaceae bacterium]